jgi:uncharacterized protein (TIGR00106 family)
MSVLLEFSMFPTDKGESVSPYVSRIIDMIDKSGANYQLTAMGTIVEVEHLRDALAIIEASYAQLETDCNRVYASLKFDIRKGKKGRLKQKIASVERELHHEVIH